jgi:hypothetical protein
MMDQRFEDMEDQEVMEDKEFVKALNIERHDQQGYDTLQHIFNSSKLGKKEFYAWYKKQKRESSTMFNIMMDVADQLVESEYYVEEVSRAMRIREANHSDEMEAMKARIRELEAQLEGDK